MIRNIVYARFSIVPHVSAGLRLFRVILSEKERGKTAKGRPRRSRAPEVWGRYGTPAVMENHFRRVRRKWKAAPARSSAGYMEQGAHASSLAEGGLRW